MKRTLVLIAIGLIIISCEKNDNQQETDNINIDLLFNEWSIVDQNINSIHIDPLIATLEIVNINTNETTILNIDLGESYMIFNDSLINFSLHTENHGSFSGKWTFESSNNELSINSYDNNDTTWNQSIFVDGIYLTPNPFLNKTYKIQSLSETQLELTYSNIYLKFEAN